MSTEEGTDVLELVEALAVQTEHEGDEQDQYETNGGCKCRLKKRYTR